ncbi:hypothetical protein [Nonomuraea rhizosphaerae]|uniref:hypothetical protein n=1 Tax=Nonomuraea rhizosphaerae TaxID=2665663 RepID=UPI001C5D7708|nr:hypothetical protein [Nonomuraea rhizosphaerae]
MSGVRRRLSGRVAVPLPPQEAFTLFTPRGEEAWVAGWRPRFPAGARDDSEPGTVFETGAHDERTTWVVLGRERGRSVSYARVTPGSRAGTVTVVLDEGPRGDDAEDTNGEVTNVGDAHAEDTYAGITHAGITYAKVTYDLTALSPEGERELRRFADGYPAFLESWEREIADHVRRSTT